MGFADDVSRWTLKAKKRGDRILQETVIGLDRTVVQATPVDTGRARANWNVGINRPDTGTDREGGAPAAKGGNRDANEARSTQAALDAAERDAKRAKAGDTVFISNNLPYIGRLEAGSSAQAPAGMVGQAVAAFDGIVDGAVRTAKREEP